MSKKLISLFMVVIMALSVFSCGLMSVNAEDTEDTTTSQVEDTTTIQSEEITTQEDEETTTELSSEPAFEPVSEPTTEPVTETTTKPPVQVGLVKQIKALYPSTVSFSLAVKQTRKITVSVLPADAKNKSIKWSTSNAKVATVSQSGVVQGVSVGKAQITATAADSSGKRLVFTVNIVARRKGTYFSAADMKTVNVWDAKYCYKDMKSDLEKLKAKYPELFTYSSMGKTYDNRNIYEVVVGNKDAKKHMIVQATMHAREYINSLLVMRQLECICANYYTGTYNGMYYSEIFDKVCLHIVPMVNPDGVAISQYGLNGISNAKLRNNAKKLCKKYGKGKKTYYTRWKANARGVDLNRNYPLNFKKKKTINHYNNEMYKGPYAASEKETVIMMNQIKRVKPKVVLSYHSTGSIIYRDFSQPKALAKKNNQLFSVVHKLTGYRAARSSGSGLKVGPCYGDWVGYANKIPTLTIETGKSAAPVNIKEFPTIWNQNKNVIPAAALWAINNM